MEGRFLSVNRAGRELLGYSEEEVPTLTVDRLIPPSFRELLLERARRRREGFLDRSACELALIARDGRHVPVEVSTSAIVSGGRVVGVQGIARDITARKALEEQLRQSQKMEAIGRLAGGVAHDFNNMLAVINGYAEILSGQLEAGTQVHQSAREILAAGQRAVALTQQLLAFSRKEMRAPRPIDLQQTVTDMEPMLRRMLGEDIELRVEGAGPVLVLADPGQMDQVILNLAVNARDAMPRGGRLSIRTARRQWDEPSQRPGPHSPGRYAVLEVHDTGHGMDEATRSRIFEPFFTTKPVGRGCGLGLATVYSIVEQSGGHIEVRTEPDQGSLFRVFLPESAEPLPQPAPIETVRSPAGTETILVAEDEPMVRRLIQVVLEQSGYRLLIAEGGEEALRIADRFPGGIDLLLTDVVMPKMSGRELSEQLVARRPGTRVLFMSGYTDDAMIRHGVEAASTALLAKPFSLAVLCRKIRELLD
jgi:PAS domain S-box-containing protein